MDGINEPMWTIIFAILANIFIICVLIPVGYIMFRLWGKFLEIVLPYGGMTKEWHELKKKRDKERNE